MRPFTKIAAPKQEPKPLTVADMTQKNFFRVQSYDAWFHLTDHIARWPVVSLKTGMLYDRKFLARQVTEVLAPGESLTIGPEVDDG